MARICRESPGAFGDPQCRCRRLQGISRPLGERQKHAENLLIRLFAARGASRGASIAPGARASTTAGSRAPERRSWIRWGSAGGPPPPCRSACGRLTPPIAGLCRRPPWRLSQHNRTLRRLTRPAPAPAVPPPARSCPSCRCLLARRRMVRGRCTVPVPGCFGCWLTSPRPPQLTPHPCRPAAPACSLPRAARHHRRPPGGAVGRQQLGEQFATAAHKQANAGAVW